MPRPWQGVVGRPFTPAEFPIYLQEEVNFGNWRPKFVVVHNTAAPTLANWHSTPGAQRMKNLEHFYKNQQGWSAGPHLFVADDLIWVFTPLTVFGIHSPSFNTKSWGVEIVGNFASESFSGAIRENAVAALAALHEFAGLDPDDIKLHKEDPNTTHVCPGSKVKKNQVIAEVKAKMGAEGDHPLGDEDTDPSGSGATAAALLQSPLLKSEPFLNTVAAGTFVLRRGKTQPKNAVGVVQDGLNKLGKPAFKIDLGPNDTHRGIFGPKTELAAINFQRVFGLDDDGVVGKNTILKLDEALLGQAEPVPTNVSGQDVELENFPDGPSPGATVVQTRTFSTGAASGSHNGNSSKTSGMKSVEQTFSDGTVVTEGSEKISAKRDNKNLGPQVASQTILRVGNISRVEQTGYSYADRNLPVVWLFEQFEGFKSNSGVHKVKASHFGKNDPIDEGTGSPWAGVIQTNSEVFGVSLPKKHQQKLFGEKPWENPDTFKATVDVFNPASLRMARVPIVDVGPSPNANAKIDLTMRLDNFLGGDGMTPVHFKVNLA